jgi:2-methylcitrate dehydratase PrpD
MIKDAFGGWPAAVGVMAGELAEKGCTGDATIFEGPMHFCQSVSDDYNLERIIRQLGSEWNILTIYRKRHAMCSQGHTTMDAGLNLLDRHGLEASAIDRVEVRSFDYLYRMNERQPKSLQAAKWSIPYCLGVVLLRRRPISPEDFSEDNLQDATVLDLARRIYVIHDLDIQRYHEEHEDRRLSEVAIETKSGEMYRTRVEYAKGWPENPLTESEIKDKFKSLARRTCSAARIDEIIRMIDRLEEVPDVRAVIELIRK